MKIHTNFFDYRNKNKNSNIWHTFDIIKNTFIGTFHPFDQIKQLFMCPVPFSKGEDIKILAIHFEDIIYSIEFYIN